jgi:hypothetical protein
MMLATTRHAMIMRPALQDWGYVLSFASEECLPAVPPRPFPWPPFKHWSVTSSNPIVGAGTAACIVVHQGQRGSSSIPA